MSNRLFQNALSRRPQPAPPIWLMRQAGRYHSRYRQLREHHSFVELCRRPELAAEVALGPILDFGFDAAILFSDLLFPLEALGIDLEYGESGPQLAWRLDAGNFGRLRDFEDAWPRLEFQSHAVAATREALPPDRSLIGFVGGLWTLFTYAVEGRHAGTLAPSKSQLSLFPRFCDRLIPLLARNIERQYAAGAELVMIFDTAAGELSPDIFAAEVVPQLERLAGACGRSPGYYSKGTQPAHMRHPLFTEGALAGIGVDYRWDMREALEFFPRGFVQGNFDPALLLASSDQLERRLRDYLAPLGRSSRDGWVCGLGHGVLPGTPEENVRRFIKLVREVMQ